ncbi:uncharacterized protein LAESUDRAFT_756017 [Laetiporus sulphureus 93-53]|uniref:Uncharacterized protein n=1 Tax=Laetiporus sulphureus 93-53 TaxID=1314785 RepID=A0A165GM00_9APHY|nr:uncharacterized protein LAESUDRAFT_756017 [Laetiporus sulphureus 93-53]KZT10535.1 hypothetical protein LAESUDRAFT_756017 [Laetiporus sulphureus 93-53]
MPASYGNGSSRMPHLNFRPYKRRPTAVGIAATVSNPLKRGVSISSKLFTTMRLSIASLALSLVLLLGQAAALPTSDIIHPCPEDIVCSVGEDCTLPVCD